MYDAIVVGARCAGAPTAMLLARKGYRVLLLDKATFPSDSFRNHFIQREGALCLKRWGLLDAILASGCPPIRKWTVDEGDFPLTGYPPPADGVDAGYAPRRIILDKILVDAAVASGAELREGFVVRDLIMDGTRVTGLRGCLNGGVIATEQARIVIGADGLHSRVACSVRAPVYRAVPALTCNYYSYWRDVCVEGSELYNYAHTQRRVIIGAFPTNGGLACVFMQWPRTEFQMVRANIEARFSEDLRLVPDLAERLGSGTRAERFVGTADLPNFFRKPFGPGWALVGDAGHHKDPLLAHGISDAFRDAELLAEAIDSGFLGRQSLGKALAYYERQRNAAALPRYERTCQWALFEPGPQSWSDLHTRALLRGNQKETDRYFGVQIGSLPPDTLDCTER